MRAIVQLAPIPNINTYAITEFGLSTLSVLFFQGLKKPYNPIIGEMFRCAWSDETSKSRTFFIAEQVSHHPPVSAFYCSNRKEGYAVGGSILAKSKFYGKLVKSSFPILNQNAHSVSRFIQ